MFPFMSLKLRAWSSRQARPVHIRTPVQPFPGRFPYELEESIISYVSHPGILFNLLTCNKAICHAALSMLYHTLDFSSLSHEILLDGSLYNQYINLLDAFTGDKPSPHAVLVRVIINIEDYWVRVMVDHSTWRRLTIPLTHLITKINLPNLRAVTLSEYYYHKLSLLQYLPKTLIELNISSYLFYALMAEELHGQLRSFLSTQTCLTTFLVQPQPGGPFYPRRSPSQEPRSDLLFSSNQQTQIKKIEGSFSLLHIFLPQTRPTHLRLYCNSDPHIPEEDILSLLSGDPEFYQRFEEIRSLSFVLPLHEGQWYQREFLNFIPHLQNLETLQLNFNIQDDEIYPQLYFIKLLINPFHGLPQLKHFIITTTTTTTSNKEQLFKVLDLFRFIPTLELLDISFDDGKEYLRSTRLLRTPGPEWGIKLARDWWLYAL